MQELEPRPAWWCEVRADQLDDPLAAAMARAGCHTVLLGVESGDPAVLQRIGKTIPKARTRTALEAAKRHGLRTEVSIMLGFPDETAAELDSTLQAMRDMAALVDVYRPLGIVMPYPGTQLYDQFHRAHRFSDWWLEKGRSQRLMDAFERGDPIRDAVDGHAKMEEAMLAVHPIRYSDDVLAAIRRCLRFRHQHNRAQLATTGG